MSYKEKTCESCIHRDNKICRRFPPTTPNPDNCELKHYIGHFPVVADCTFHQGCFCRPNYFSPACSEHKEQQTGFGFALDALDKTK